SSASAGATDLMKRPATRVACRLIAGSSQERPMDGPHTTVCIVFDLDRYLARVGLRGRPAVAEVHRAHITSIPFENLDPHRGVPVSLAVDDLERKLVAERRGGYCFEQNLLLKAALEALGADVDLFLARVRSGAAAGLTRPRSPH